LLILSVVKLTAFGDPHAIVASDTSDGSRLAFGAKGCPFQFNCNIEESNLIVPCGVPLGSASKMNKLKFNLDPGLVRNRELFAKVTKGATVEKKGFEEDSTAAINKTKLKACFRKYSGREHGELSPRKAISFCAISE
jgi:hypothetical protein